MRHATREELEAMNDRELFSYYCKTQLPFTVLGGVIGAVVVTVVSKCFF